MPVKLSTLPAVLRCATSSNPTFSHDLGLNPPENQRLNLTFESSTYPERRQGADGARFGPQRSNRSAQISGYVYKKAGCCVMAVRIRLIVVKKVLPRRGELTRCG
jgi:hypothetical protein